MIRHILKIVWNRKRANALIVAEIFLSFLVLFAVLTLASALIGSVTKPLGYEWRNVWNISLENERPRPPADGPWAKTAGGTEKEPDVTQLIMHELRAMPQVEAVGASATPPYSMSANEGSWGFGGKTVSLTIDFATDGFADVMQLEILSGRWFQPQDDAANYTPVVIDTDLARTVYGTENPIGRRFNEEAEKEMRVVGVIAPYRKSGEFANFGKPVNMMFERASAAKSDTLPGNVVVRLRPGTPSSFEETLSDRIHQVAPQMNFRIRHMTRMRQFAHRTALFPLVVLLTVAAFLIAMVILGLSGVLWQNVTRRTRELGLRRAIGASAGAVQRQIVAEVAMLTTLAVVAGLAVVAQLPILGLFSLITPGAFAGGLAASLAAIYALTVLCGVYPGWLASRVQPAQALHYE
ncbi:MAG TPA: ABC transporter permease [Thermoanaerobaculia bacterium]|nr:ABC transporter permease [Thermoanaerobaculia bacterium]